MASVDTSVSAGSPSLVTTSAVIRRAWERRLASSHASCPTPVAVWRYVSFAAQQRTPRSGSARGAVRGRRPPTGVPYDEFVRAVRRFMGTGLLRLLDTAWVGQWPRSPRVLFNA